MQPPGTPEFNQESFEGMSQSDEEMEVVESTETMEGVDEESMSYGTRQSFISDN